MERLKCERGKGYGGEIGAGCGLYGIRSQRPIVCLRSEPTLLVSENWHDEQRSRSDCDAEDARPRFHPAQHRSNRSDAYNTCQKIQEKTRDLSCSIAAKMKSLIELKQYNAS